MVCFNAQVENPVDHNLTIQSCVEVGIELKRLVDTNDYQTTLIYLTAALSVMEAGLIEVSPRLY